MKSLTTAVGESTGRYQTKKIEMNEDKIAAVNENSLSQMGKCQVFSGEYMAGYAFMNVFIASIGCGLSEIPMLNDPSDVCISQFANSPKF